MPLSVTARSWEEKRLLGDLDLSTVDRLLTSTRAVRKRLDLTRPVGRDVILECLRLSQQAPTGSNAQTWRWLVVTDPAKRKALGELYRTGGGNHVSEVLKHIEERDPQSQRVIRSAMYLVEHLADVPVHVIPCIIGRLPERAAPVQMATLYGSIFPAVWSFQLALRSRGLGSALTTLHLTREREAATLLGIPDGVTQVGLIPVAYTTGGDFKPAARPPVEGITYWESWEQSGD